MRTDTTFDHWDTTPVQIKTKKVKGKVVGVPIGCYQPDDYTGEEWRVRQSVEKVGDEMWNQSCGLDTSEFDYL